MLDWLTGTKKDFKNPIHTDLHSHLIPEVDDGVASLEESVEIIRHFYGMGYKKIITTPHIMHEFYDNSPETILPGLTKLKETLEEEQIPMEIEAAAEYYLDDYFFDTLLEKQDLLTFGDQYILVETPFLNAPFFLKDAVFQLNAKGYKVVLAHPERYIYLQKDDKLLQTLLDMQVLFQVNISSLIGHYSKNVKKFALQLLDNGYIRFVGSDCHNLTQLQTVKRALNSKFYRKLPFEDLLNNTL